MRGEYQPGQYLRRPWGELPPRARRILFWATGVLNSLGTTSACAENTIENSFRQNGNRNYLRVRGEYEKEKIAYQVDGELPPRARRILPSDSPLKTFPGTTSACAENTQLGGLGFFLSGNYLRVRGEYVFAGDLIEGYTELPPRARRIPWAPWL